VAASGMVINLLINFVLVPRLMAIGSAYASLFTQFTTAIIQTFIAVRIFRFKADYKYLASLFVFLIGTVAISKFSKLVFDQWVFNFLLMIAASLLLAMALKLLNIKGFIQILKSKEEFTKQ
jgi:O-antigen/teichoic acid export membrane protein